MPKEVSTTSKRPEALLMHVTQQTGWTKGENSHKLPSQLATLHRTPARYNCPFWCPLRPRLALVWAGRVTVIPSYVSLSGWAMQGLGRKAKKIVVVVAEGPADECALATAIPVVANDAH